ncbi:hypothetical protein V757_08445 [Pelistega indica]|uniref:Uncharacterized protein n=2 Tax=Pelistega TaxID=106146 RepID=V8G1U3_9BURK|nr:hypothetical protein [Pelistega indica]ETD70051.1 hypothetical protein V757_08445 [Pelistega indica]
MVAQWILAFGAKQDYAFLASYSNQIVDYLNSINKYIWWGLVLFGSVLLYFILSGWISSSLKKASHIVPNQEVMEELIPKLSKNAQHVLLWVWNDQREPITIQNLYDTRNQLRHDRISRLAQINRQRELLGYSMLPTQAEKDNQRELEKVEHVLGNIDLNLTKEDSPTH